jgi:PHP family Zn ribbon phosphoesterase
MQVIADLHIHSKFARAVSKEMTLPNIHNWAKRKGIDLIATGDFTHPLWFKEIERDLVECGNGLLRLNEKTDSGDKISNLINPSSPSSHSSPYFMLSTEISCIYSQDGKGRRVHTLVYAPTLESVRKINQALTKRGCNLMSDGRPIIGLSSIVLAELILNAEPNALIIPAHIWTPWFSVFGAMSGYKTLKEAFGEFADQIYGVETGLSSNPSMNWQIAELDNRAILSSSDAHSGPKIGREATVFNLDSLSYDNIRKAIIGSDQKAEKTHQPPATSNQPSNSIGYTIEFYPEEGKYHYTGHRSCNIRWGPDETREKGTVCPVCGKPLTQGVVQRIEDLAARTEGDLKLSAINYQTSDKGTNIKMIKSDTFPNRPPFVMLVPLQEIIAEAIGSPVASKKVSPIYDKLVAELGGEFNVLLHATQDEIAKKSNDRIAEGVVKVRNGDIVIDPGYDGVFGIVKIWKDGRAGLVDKSKEQLGMF